MKCRQRLYLVADKAKLVPAGHKEAASLYAVPGDEIPQSAADRFGLVDGHLKGSSAEKDAGAGKDKDGKGGSDKGGGSPSELTKVKGVGAKAAAALTAGGIIKIADLAAVDVENPPKIDGLPVFNWKAVVPAAKESIGQTGSSGEQA